MDDSEETLRAWASLGEDERLALQIAYQPVLDKEPLTCSLDAKIERFAAWLKTRGVAFSSADLRR
jgi:hypothetical protein